MLPPAVAGPMVKPNEVIRMSFPPEQTKCSPAVMTTDEDVVTTTVTGTVKPVETQEMDPGSEDAAKKPDGKFSVILLAAASAPPAVVRNKKVAAEEDLLATRSVSSMTKETLVTSPPIAPEATSPGTGDAV